MKVINTVVAVALLSVGMTSVCHAGFGGVDVKSTINNNRTYNTNNSRTNNTSSSDYNANRTTSIDRTSQRSGRDSYKDTKNSFNRTNSNDIGGDVSNSVLGNMNLTNNGNASASGSVGSVSSSGKKGGGAHVGSMEGITGHTAVGGSQNIQLGSNSTTNTYGDGSGNYSDSRQHYKEDNSTNKKGN